ncbi:serine hydrolase [Hydrogenoanaerobacterium sp.]|uniref:serine hydrolase domain-containing protein n=1 Tax=Hydrogenoanaerobacterium sp. TaxID=2953763 RepID=UPI0028A07AB6|nr:serine hydrolase [Hydrogenoanaerobacterium sp.]
MNFRNKVICGILITSLCTVILVGFLKDNSKTPLVESGTAQLYSAEKKQPEIGYFTNTIANNKAELDLAINRISEQYGVKGCSIAVWEHDTIVYSHSYGVASIRQMQQNAVKKPASQSTKYRVASISKVVTTMLAMTLQEQGKLSLDMDIAALVNENLQNSFYPDDNATIEMLMTHTSGIIDGAGYTRALNMTPFPSLDVVLQRNNFSGSKPGTAYSYSNFGMGLVAGAVEKLSGKHFYDYARDTLFEPLGADAAFITDYIKDKDSIAAFSSTDPLSWGSMAELYGQIPLGQMYLLGQGELYISADDLARIGIILSGDGTYEGKRYLKQETLKNIHTPRVYDSVTNVTRGLAVQISPDIIEGVTLYGHQGNAYGAISCLFYDPVTKRGAVFLTNGASAKRAESQIYAVNDAIVKQIWQYL